MKLPLTPLFLFIFLTISSISTAQKHTISGYITDEATGEKLIGANIFEPKSTLGTASNIYGFYSLTFPANDSIGLIFRFIGYKAQSVILKLDRDITLNIKLNPSVELRTVEIIENRNEKIEERSQMSTIDIPISQIKNLPALLGEVDVLKSLQLLPGVQSGGEGSSGFYVRGGGPDQNLILLDGAPVYNASHLFGFFSVFNADAIRNVELTKGGFPARYGGRLSSVLEINMKEGNSQKLKGEGTLGLIASKLTIEGPIYKDRTSFIVSGRRTYYDLLARPFIKAATSGTSTGGYYFYDLNAKVNHKINDRHHLYLSFYGGDDRFFVRGETSSTYNNIQQVNSDEYKLGWGNLTSTLRWNYLINPKLFCNTSLIYSQFKFYVGAENEMKEITSSGITSNTFSLNYLSGINDYSGKVDFDFLPNPNHYIKFGFGNTSHKFNTGALQFRIQNNTTTSIDTSIGVSAIYANEISSYIENDHRITSRMKANYGLHYSGFSVKNKYYNSLQPRFSARYFINENWAIKTSYAYMMQYIHLLTNSNIGLPTDLWVPSTERIKPETSQQIASGVARTFRIKEENYEFSIEGYYKYMHNIIDFLAGADFMNSNDDWQNKVESGKGWAYGGEFFIQKKTGKTTGWVGYTLSWTNRQFPTINFGNTYPYKYDRRHDISFVLSHKFSDKLSFAATWVYGTGNAISLPTARYLPLNSGYYYSDIQHYPSKNSFRMKAYHRADLGVNFTKEKKWGERTLSVGVYNLYSNKNPYFLYFGNDILGNRRLKQISLFPIIPSISYNFKF